MKLQKKQSLFVYGIFLVNTFAISLVEFIFLYDIFPVENAVASELSNGFVKGTNSKIKMVKRTMYGCYSKKIIESKTELCPV